MTVGVAADGEIHRRPDLHLTVRVPVIADKEKWFRDVAGIQPMPCGVYLIRIAIA
jgi:hypothetical protein